VAGGDPGRAGIGGRQSGLSGEGPQPGLRAYAAMTRLSSAIEVVVSFYRGPLTNHGTPLPLQPPGRIQFAPLFRRTHGASKRFSVLLCILSERSANFQH
jgi:hypothetical protein